MRPTAIGLLLGVTALIWAPNAAGLTPYPSPPGFRATIAPPANAGPALNVECSLERDTFSCRWIGHLPARARCRFGGAVPTWVLRRTGPARATYVCMDEGYHGWMVLPRGRTWRAGGFVCRHRLLRTRAGRRGQLLCRARSGHGFAVTSANRPVRIRP